MFSCNQPFPCMTRFVCINHRKLLGPWTAHPQQPDSGRRPHPLPRPGRQSLRTGMAGSYALLKTAFPQYGTHVRVFEIEELTAHHLS